MSKVPVNNVNALYSNSTPGTVISPTIFDDAIQDIVATINGNDTYVQSLVSGGAVSPVVPDFMGRQAMINANFDVWQREIFSANPSFGSYLADHYLISFSADGGVFPANIVHSRLELSNGELPGSFYAYRIQTDGAGSGFGADSVYGIYHRVEKATRYLCGVGKQMTLSFYARSNIANKRLGISLSQRYGTGGSPSPAEDIIGSTFTLTPSWNKYSLTFNTNTLDGKVFGTDANDYIQIGFNSIWGSNRNSLMGTNSSETFVGSGVTDIAQVELSAGNVALPFQPRSFADELTLCQRYFRRVGYGMLGQFYSANSIGLAHTLSTPMRISPNITLNKNNPQILEMNVGIKVGTASAITFSAKTQTGFIIEINGFTGGTVNNMIALADDAIDLEAEL